MLNLARQAIGSVGRANIARGFSAGITGKIGRMPSQMFAGGYRAGVFARSPLGGAAIGGGLGGMYGAMSNDTSIIGGAMMGAGLGAGAAFGGSMAQGAWKQSATANATLSSNIGRTAGHLWSGASRRIGGAWVGATQMSNQARNGFKVMNK